MSPYIFNPNSKTHWVNAAGMVASGALLVLPGLDGSIPASAYPWILAGFAFVNHILRSVTNKAITDK